MAESVSRVSWRDISKLIGAEEKETHDRYLHLSSRFAASTWKPEEDARLKRLVIKYGAKEF